jgi:hypothetical protein
MAREPLKQQARLDFRFGSKADIGEGAIDVRFTPKSGHQCATMPGRFKTTKPEGRPHESRRAEQKGQL